MPFRHCDLDRHNLGSFVFLINFGIQGIDCLEVKLQRYVIRRRPVLRQRCDMPWECLRLCCRDRYITTQAAGCDSADDHLFNSETDDGRVVLESNQGQIPLAAEEDTFFTICTEEFDDALPCQSTCIAAITTPEIKIEVAVVKHGSRSGNIAACQTSSHQRHIGTSGPESQMVIEA